MTFRIELLGQQQIRIYEARYLLAFAPTGDTKMIDSVRVGLLLVDISGETQGFNTDCYLHRKREVPYTVFTKH